MSRPLRLKITRRHDSRKAELAVIGHGKLAFLWVGESAGDQDPICIACKDNCAEIRSFLRKALERMEQ